MVDIDVETAILDSPSRFTKTLVALVGVAAIIAALLAVLENHAGRQEERSLVYSARLTAAATGRLPASGTLGAFELRSIQQSIARQASGTGRLIAITDGESGVDLDSHFALGEATTAAGEKLVEIAGRMGAVPGPESGLDPFTLDVLARGSPAAAELVAQQNREVDAAERFGRQANQAVLALSVFAVAAVLFGFAGAVRDSRPGVAALSVASLFLVASVAIGAVALLL